MQRRTPEISAGEWAGEIKQGVADAVITTDHAAELRLEGIKGVTEGDEHKTGAFAFAPRHRTPENKCARLKAFLLGALNVRRSRCAIEFLVITTPAADRMILLALVPPLWRRVMDPRVAAHYGGDLVKANRGHAPEPAMTTGNQPVLGDAPATRCPGCGYTYVVARGDEHEGLAPGTPWSAIADDWCCPDCGVRSKQDFTRVEAIPLDR